MGKARSGFQEGVAVGSTPSQGGSHSPAADPSRRVITQATHPGAQVPIGKAPTNSKDGVILTPRRETHQGLVPQRGRERGGEPMTANYKPTEAEIEAFNRDLRRYVAFVGEEDGGELTANDLRVLADHHWPGRNVRVKSDWLGIDWVETNPDRADDKPQQPAAPQVAAAAASPQPSAAHPNPAVERARRDFQDIYGNQQGVKIITAGEGYDRSGWVVDAHLNPMSRSDGLDDQARAEIAALPAYGSPGWGEAKRKLVQIRQAAARRAAAAQQATPGRSERAAAREAVAGFEGVQTGTWDQVRAAAGQQLLYERNRAMARKWEPKR